jgi:hypothetical protein
MHASASTIKQKLPVETARPAATEAVLDTLQSLVPQLWAAIFAEVVPSAAKTTETKSPFEAVRHECSVTAPNLRIAGPEESFVSLRPVDRQGERYRGKHGKVTLIRKAQ